MVVSLRIAFIIDRGREHERVLRSAVLCGADEYYIARLQVFHTGYLFKSALFAPRYEIRNDAALNERLIGEARAVEYPVDQSVAARAEGTVVDAGVGAGIAVFEFGLARVFRDVMSLSQKIAL